MFKFSLLVEIFRFEENWFYINAIDAVTMTRQKIDFNGLEYSLNKCHPLWTEAHNSYFQLDKKQKKVMMHTVKKKAAA